MVFKRYRKHVIVLAVLGALAAFLEGIGINAVIPLFSAFSAGGPAEATNFITQGMQAVFEFFSIPFTFRYLLGFILAMFFLRAIASVIFGYIRGWIAADFLSDETKSLLREMLLSSWPFLLKQKIGNLQNTVIRDLERTGNLLEVISQTIQSFTGFLIYLVIAFSISSQMTLLTLVGGGLLLFVVKPLLQRTRRTSEEMTKTEKGITQFLGEHIIGMKSVKAAGMERTALKAINNLVENFRALAVKMSLIRSVSASLFQPFSIVFVVILFVLTYQTPGFNIISFGAVLYLIQKIFTYLESGQSALHSISVFLPHAHNVLNLKRALHENREEKTKGSAHFLFKHSLKFENVSLTYQDAKEVLRGISFEASPGETIGIVGPSGAGKTSVADLMLRLFNPTEGVIMLDGVPARDIPLEEWRKRVAYVSQDVFLFNSNIKENIRFYRDDVSDEEIVAAAKQANIYEFVQSLPDGFETTTGDRGVMLSGGQRQRVALARALAQKPSILVLDEATSALDHESEKLIQEAIDSLHGNVTVITIAHRPSTVAEADKILVLDQGEVVEMGSAKKLLSNTDSYFYKMQSNA